MVVWCTKNKRCDGSSFMWRLVGLVSGNVWSDLQNELWMCRVCLVNIWPALDESIQVFFRHQECQCSIVIQVIHWCRQHNSTANTTVTSIHDTFSLSTISVTASGFKIPQMWQFSHEVEVIACTPSNEHFGTKLYVSYLWYFVHILYFVLHHWSISWPCFLCVPFSQP